MRTARLLLRLPLMPGSCTPRYPAVAMRGATSDARQLHCRALLEEISTTAAHLKAKRSAQMAAVALRGGIQQISTPGPHSKLTIGIEIMPSSFRIFEETNYPYFVTCTVVDWAPIFQNNDYCQIILNSLNFIRKRKRTQVNAFVVMPSHLHAILWPTEGVSLSDVMRDFKRYTSRQISNLAKKGGEREYLEIFSAARERGRSTEVSTYQVWQEGFHPEAIYTEEFALQKMNYIHQNPVRAGLVNTDLEWPYSSAHAYYLDEDGNSSVDILRV